MEHQRMVHITVDMAFTAPHQRLLLNMGDER